jgi:triosephosphate isomerase
MNTPRLVIGNWKMNTSRAEAISIADRLRSAWSASDVTIGVAPPFPWLVDVKKQLDGTGIMLGAQTCAATANGAFTGEVSAAMVAEICDFVLVGHSERRSLFGETDSVVRQKLSRVLENDLQPVLCVGETLEQRQDGTADAVVAEQLVAALGGLERTQLAKLVIAYEPVWAIGTGQTATPADASAMGAMVNGVVARLGRENVPVLYGGSVTAQNAGSLIAEPSIDGFLVGGASLMADDFLAIAAAASN